MWHEARRQERKIRGMLVDYRRRAERRRDFYEKIKADPTQFLQIYGRQCKICLDPAVAVAAENAAVMMPWQGHADNLIDRFDVRAHLDHIEPPPKSNETEELLIEERQTNYERYRIIAQNAFLGISEEKFLRQMYLEEQFGYTDQQASMSKGSKRGDKGAAATNPGVAIGFNYEDGTACTLPAATTSNAEEENDSNDSDDNSDLDVDLALDVSKLDTTQAHEMNRHGHSYGMSSNDFYSFLVNDLEEAKSYRLDLELENEKMLFSGRKSRRERRAHREKRLANRILSPPSYAATNVAPSIEMQKLLERESKSKSQSPENSGKITYITSFGGEDEEPAAAISSASAHSTSKSKHQIRRGSVERKRVRDGSRHRSSRRYRTRSRSRGRHDSYRNRRSRSRSRYRTRRRRSRSRSFRRRSRSLMSRDRSRSRSNRRINSRRNYRRDRSRSRSRLQYRSRRTRSRCRSRSAFTRRGHPPQQRRTSKSRSSSSHSKRRESSKSSKSPSVSDDRSHLVTVPETKVNERIICLENPKDVENIAAIDANGVCDMSVGSVPRRYYGRRKSNESSSSELSDLDVDTETQPQNIHGTTALATSDTAELKTTLAALAHDKADSFGNSTGPMTKVKTTWRDYKSSRSA